MDAVEYPGGIKAVTLIDTAAKTRIALRTLNKATHLGFDTETKPSFQRGRTNKVALLQISNGEHCFLFRLNVPGIFEMVKPLLENPDIIKIGLSVHDDFNALRRRGEINPSGFLDLQDYCRTFLISDISLQKIYAIIFGQRISKTQRLTNWEAPHLTDAQQIYAAIDAWACLKLYRYLRSGQFHPLESPYLHYPQEHDKTQSTPSATLSTPSSEAENLLSTQIAKTS